MTPIDLIVACALDAVLGDPRRLPHPVRLMGRIIGGFETGLRKIAHGPASLRMAGIALAIGLPVMSYAAGSWMIELAAKLHPQAGRWIGIWLAFTTLAARDLVDHARAVGRALETGSLVRARQAVSRIVGRDTDHLSEPEVVRATVETIAESTSDGVIAPLVYLVVGGPPLALAYKAINTLDSMIGHHDDRYRDFGWASARLDDAVNWLPARLTAVLFVVAAGLYTRTMRQAWHIMQRDGAKHPSPNSGRPEAAMAGALGVQLGGTNFYGGHRSVRSHLGDRIRPLNPVHITAALRLMAVASLLAVMLAVTIVAR